MFNLLPDAFHKISVRKALALTVCFSILAGVSVGQILVFTARLRPSGFDYLDMLLQTLLSAALAIRFYVLTLTRIDEQRAMTVAQK